MTLEDRHKKFEEYLHATPAERRKFDMSFLEEPLESEDERTRDTIFNCLYQCCDIGFISSTQRDNALAWLEKQKEHWKPSEEHLSALLAVFNDPNNIGSQTCQLALTELYEQFKKLM